VIHGRVFDCGPCPYLPDRRFQAFQPDALPAGVTYRELMDHGFRRSGAVLYRPMCAGCAACQPIRVAVAGFVPRRDQRRCAQRNADLAVTWAARGMDDERLPLWQRYEVAVHGRALADLDSGDHLAASGTVPGGELHARDAQGRLLAVSVVDVLGDALSSVYCYYEPTERARALGTFMALAELTWARAAGMVWWYPGFYVAGCAKMAYKARFGPAELLTDQGWVGMVC
jgi:arginyl-tRNA--protein-N-Asp/Glu arginylyltransferase